MSKTKLKTYTFATIILALAVLPWLAVLGYTCKLIAGSLHVYIFSLIVYGKLKAFIILILLPTFLKKFAVMVDMKLCLTVILIFIVLIIG